MAITNLNVTNLGSSPDIVSEVQSISANRAVALLGRFELAG
jgi:hypothetical protein